MQFDLDSSKEIDDADIAKAFAASPQMGERVKVAYYAFDDSKAKDVEGMLANVPNVSSTYRIPNMLMSGRRRFDEQSYGGGSHDFSIKKLRLLAARAHADVLVIFDNGWRGGGVNGLVALNILIVPIFFVPAYSNETESYAQGYVIDVRNGFLYGEVSAEQKDGKDYVTIWAKSTREIADEQWPKVLDGVKVQLRDKLKPTPAVPAAVPEKTPPTSGALPSPQ
jgi:hypothetical protein